MTSWKGKILRLLFSLAFTLGMLEVLLRFFYLLPVTAKGAYLCRHKYADHMHYPYGVGRMKTGEFNVVLTMNNIGMRDDDVGPKVPGRRRLLVIGDSFMEGWGCERGEIFTDRLESELKMLGKDVEVVAAGVASWSTLAEAAWLRHEGFDLQPDAVLLSFDATDCAGDSFYAHRLERDGRGRPDHIRPGRRRFDFPAPVHEFLAAHSYMYRYIDRALTKKFPVTEWDYGFWAETDDVWAPMRSDSEIPDALYESYWTRTREALVTINELCAEKKIPFLLLQHPAGVETDSSCWETGRGTAKFGPGLIAPRRFEYMQRMTDRDSVPYFSLLDVFRRAERPARLFFPYDGHWSKKGHALAAEAVAAELVRRGMI